MYTTIIRTQQQQQQQRRQRQQQRQRQRQRQRQQQQQQQQPSSKKLEQCLNRKKSKGCFYVVSLEGKEVHPWTHIHTKIYGIF